MILGYGMERILRKYHCHERGNVTSQFAKNAACPNLLLDSEVTESPFLRNFDNLGPRGAP